MARYNVIYTGPLNPSLDQQIAGMLEAEVETSGYLLVGRVRDLQLVTEQPEDEPAMPEWLAHAAARLGCTVEVLG